MRSYFWMGATTALLLVVAFGLGRQGVGQTGNPRANNASSSHGILPPQAYLTDRDSSLERDLNRLKTARAGMGINHPKLAEVDRRIGELEDEIETFRAIPNPFQEFEEQGVSPQDIVERLGERELRILVVRLAVDVKDLRQRVAALERFIPSR